MKNALCLPSRCICICFILSFVIPALNCLACIEGSENKVVSCTKFCQLSQTEKEWYKKFQNGIPFFDGWKQISHKIIKKFPDTEQVTLKRNLRNLGDKIGIEWCKDNTIRKINTQMLREWGKKINSAVDRGKNHLLVTINTVEREVDSILMNTIASTQK